MSMHLGTTIILVQTMFIVFQDSWFLVLKKSLGRSNSNYIYFLSTYTHMQKYLKIIIICVKLIKKLLCISTTCSNEKKFVYKTTIIFLTPLPLLKLNNIPKKNLFFLNLTLWLIIVSRNEKEIQQIILFLRNQGWKIV